jgi:uncharacterized protein (TIGR00369 family)
MPKSTERPSRRDGSHTGQKKNFCFACGPDNPTGMHLKFKLDKTGKRYVCHFRLTKRYTGPPGHCHGGIIATILDDAMSKLNRLFEVPAATSRMMIQYLRPVTLNRSREVSSWNISKRGRRLSHTAEIRDEKGTVLARGRGLFVMLDPQHVFRSAK